MSFLQEVERDMEVARQAQVAAAHVFRNEQVARIAFAQEQRRLGLPLIEQARGLIGVVKELVDYENSVVVPDGFRRAKRLQAAIEKRRADPMGISGFGFLDGDPTKVVAVTQDIEGEPDIYHNGTPFLHFTGFYPSYVGAIGKRGMFEAILLNEQRADELAGYLTQLHTRVEWQQASHIDVRVHGAVSLGPDTFSDRVIQEARGNLFLEQFVQAEKII